MLDYAANAVVYFPVESIRSQFEERCLAEGLDADEEVRTLRGDAEGEPDDFWNMVRANLRDGKVRMLFVADRIPPELRRIVEFLNGQLNRAEVLAVEVRQYLGGGVKTLVPVLVGQTTQAEESKGTGTRARRQWTEDSFRAALAEKRDQGALESADALLTWAKNRNLLVSWRTGQKDGSFSPFLQHGGEDHPLFQRLHLRTARSGVCLDAHRAVP
jgi:hypothetical protein